MRMKKTLSILLVICMLMGLFPMFSANVKAAESTDKTGDLYLDKTAVLEEDGSYTIKLEAYATGTPVTTQVKTGKPLQIVIAVDQSGSMENDLDDLQNAITEFVQIVAANGRNFNVEHKIAVVGFASSGGDSVAWNNTGLFDSNGEFKNYVSGKATYTPYTGELNLDDSYYVKLSDGTCVEVMRQEARYQSVANPDTNRKNLYAIINGKYLPVEYMTYEGYVKLADIGSMVQGNTYYTNDRTTGEKIAISFGDCYSETTYNPKTSSWGSGILYSTGDVVYVLGEDGTMTKLTCTRTDRNRLFFTSYQYSWKTEDGTSWTLESGDSIYQMNINDATDIYEQKKSTAWFHTNARGDKIEVTAADTLYEKEEGTFWVYTDENGFEIEVSDEALYTREGGELEGVDYRDALVPITNGQNGQGEIRQSIMTSINGISSNGATRTSYGMEMAKHIFEYNHETDSNSEHDHVVIVFTDGAPGRSGYDSTEANASLANAEVLKSEYDAAIYTVGLYNQENITEDGDSVNEFMDRLSSNYEGVTTMSQSATAVADKYYQTTEYVSELNSIFTNITVDSTTTSTTVALDDTAIMRDILGTGMELMPGTTITAIKVPGAKASNSANIVWNTNNAESLGSLTIDKDKPISEFTNDENSNIKLYNLNGNVMGDSGKSHPHTVDVSGFDYCGDYIAVGKDGYKLVVTITGVEASAYAIWNQAMYTNNDYSGIWTPQTETADRELQASFVQPTTMLTSTNYVMDYAKPFEVDLANDLGMNTVYHLDADDTNRFDPANPVHNVQGTYGEATIENNTLTYTPMTMSWGYEADNPNKRGYETIYAFGNTTDEHVLANTANAAEGHLWSRFNVIPANNIYYEDDFVTTSTDGTTQTGTIGIEYSGVWQNDGTTSGNTANENGGTHGWIESLSTESGYSDGSAHVSSTPGARATFTFTGTGVDIYSRTDKSTGLVIGMLYKGHGIKDENGKNKVAEKMIWMDTLSESSGEGAYYQIPTLSFSDLEYGTYTVMLTVAKDLIKDDDERMTYYLDGIRVYNPLKNRENVDSTITDAYGKSEINAIFKEVRDCLLTEGSYGADEVSGAVFIDKFGDKVGYEESELIADFETFGPKNEVYLANGQLIAFVVSYDAGAQYYVGMKSISGTAIKSTYQYQGASKEVAINHTADLYYEVTPEWKDTNNDGVYDKGIVSIANTGGTGVLAISKLKIANPMPEAVEIAMFSSMSRAQLISYANTLDMNVAVEEDGKVEIENSEEEKEKVENVNPDEVPVENLDGISEKLFAEMYGWF